MPIGSTFPQLPGERHDRGSCAAAGAQSIRCRSSGVKLLSVAGAGRLDQSACKLAQRRHPRRRRCAPPAARRPHAAAPPTAGAPRSAGRGRCAATLRGAALAIRSGQFALRDASISAEDRSTQPAAKVLLAPLSVQVDGASLDLAKPVRVELDTRINETGSLNA